jgi:hypothetical protein
MFVRIGVLIVGALALMGALPAECEKKLQEETVPVADSPAAGATGADINFLTICLYSHRAPDDPIVAPNAPGGSHSHDFFGNTSTNNASTYESLLAHSATSCNRVGDTAAYWAPSLLVEGAIIQPHRINAYYRPGGKDPASIQPFPAGLKVIAGDSKATAPQDLRIVSWGCSSPDPMSSPKPSVTPVTCPFAAAQRGAQGGLKVRIRFPDCWNGVDLDSPDHKSHMAYSRRGACPETHPVPVPQITMNVVYPTAGGPGVVLASGNSALTGHADFFNAWDQPTLKMLVENCLNTSQHCGAKGGGAELQKRK